MPAHDKKHRKHYDDTECDSFHFKYLIFYSIYVAFKHPQAEAFVFATHTHRLLLPYCIDFYRKIHTIPRVELLSTMTTIVLKKNVSVLWLLIILHDI